MSLKEILEGIVQNNTPILLCSGDKEYEASTLLVSNYGQSSCPGETSKRLNWFMELLN